jgi:oligopeptide/dipeptide ABC transporter ATP-binding protein
MTTPAAGQIAAPAADDTPLLEARALSVVFPVKDGEPVTAVEDFSVAIRPGEFVGVMGEPGCGKSTAAIALMGLVRPPGRIATGSVNFLGQDLLRLSDEQVAAIRGRDVSLIVQNPRTSLHPLLTVGRQISKVYRAHNRVSRKQAWRHAIDMLRLVGINDPERRVKSYAHELSSGMTQRVLIAMAMSSNPKLLIADEPTSGLDVTIQAQFLDQMWEAANQTGSAVLLVTQDLGIIANYCDRVLIMERGRIVEEAPARQFFLAPRHAYSQRILAIQRDEDAGGVRPARAADVAAAEPLLAVQSLTKQFPIRGSDAKVHAADQVSFEIRRGETLGLVGESGSGKTTVGRCIVRLEDPTAGEIRYRGEDIGAIKRAQFTPYRKIVQIVFQDPFDAMNPRWTVEETLREPLKLHTDLAADAVQVRVTELLEMVGLAPGLRHAKPRQLSAGRQQRVAIARAIATGPEFVVLDEPTSALSPEARAEIIRLLIALSQRLGIAYLFISHDLTTVKYICHRVVVMYLGQVVEVGDKEALFDEPRHPYAKALLASHLFPDISDRRVDRAERITLKGEIPSPVSLPKGCYLYGRCPSQVERCAAMPQALAPMVDGRLVRCWRGVACRQVRPCSDDLTISGEPGGAFPPCLASSAHQPRVTNAPPRLSPISRASYRRSNQFP